MKKRTLRVITLGDPRLTKKSAPVEVFDEALTGFMDEMFRTLAAKKGLGLAAVQVGSLTRIFITQAPDDGPRVFINPELIATSEELVNIEEGCLSVPNKYEVVSRPATVTVQAFSATGKPFSLSTEGILARVIQHELDHLNGILFIDRIDGKKREAIEKSFKRRMAI